MNRWIIDILSKDVTDITASDGIERDSRIVGMFGWFAFGFHKARTVATTIVMQTQSGWLAGGGFKRGYAHGQANDFGYKAVHDVVTVHDLYATLLNALGLNHQRLTWPHDSRPSSHNDVVITNARVVPELLA